MGKEAENGPLVEKAKLADAEQIQKLINFFAGQGDMLYRPLSEIYEDFRDYFVYRDGEGNIAGCASLHVLWKDMGEIRSVAVDQNHRGRGIGTALVNACLDEAQSFKIPTIFLCTGQPEFFKRFDFEPVDPKTVPKKAWGECPRCTKYPNCGETIMIRKIDQISRQLPRSAFLSL